MIEHQSRLESPNNPPREVCAPDGLDHHEEQWEFELEVIGGAATLRQLEELLERAPNPESATAQFLTGYLASHANHQN